ncbi:Protein N-acetyltransferase, RimJ/RimL family [Agromyces sp. CF514]|uniref:GNAT family N-acetyltransferase n=1 Tax=Agromyces sp. CF514 TaxID=1881031 RepID=UPI0008ED7EB8|nr:GNAT family N-acetyltransferase [Agromyces sp. CF514]SFR85996.1 Protein N-acetyltransferase, RimJ/RimL family [Agromyces sp. CF514]
MGAVVEPVELETPRLVLDLPVPSDADLVTRYCQDPLFEQYLTTPWPYEHAHAESFLGEHVPAGWTSGSELTWAIRTERGGPLLGVISVREAQHEIGFWMGSEHRGAGLMSEAANAVCEWVLSGGIGGASTVFWRAVEGNLGSAKVARSAGFRHIEPENPTVPTRDGRGTLPAWFGVRETVVDPRAEASWHGILGERS